MNDFQQPWFTNILWIAAPFFGSLILFHYLLIEKWPLNSIQWKKIDYIWIPLALIGVITTVEQNRIAIQRDHTKIASMHSEFALNSALDAIEKGMLPAFCRNLVHRESFTQPNDQFDAQCIWFKTLEEKLKNINLDKITSIDLSELIEEYPLDAEKSAYTTIKTLINDINRNLIEKAKLKKLSDTNNFHLLLQFLSPYFLAVAIALRLTKVSGEIKLECNRKK